MKQTIANLAANWKTTSAGLTLIIGAITHLAFAVAHGTADESTWKNDLIGMMAGVGLLLAADGISKNGNGQGGNGGSGGSDVPPHPGPLPGGEGATKTGSSSLGAIAPNIQPATADSQTASKS